MALSDDNELNPAPLPPEHPNAPAVPANGPTGALSLTRKRAVGHGTARMQASDVTSLPPIPSGSLSAILVLEAAPNATAGKVLGRFWTDGTWPDVVQGMPMYDGAVIELIGNDDLVNFRMISTDGKLHKINVQFYNYL